MTLISMPYGLFGKIKRRQLMTTEAATASPFTGSQQIQDWGGEWWEYDMDFALHQGRQGKKMSAFFAQLGRGRNTFLMADWSIDQVVAGTPVVSGAGQSGNALVTSGWPVSSTVLQYGDFFQIGTAEQTRLHQLTADAVSNGSGVATLSFVPALRSSPANAAPLVVNAPQVHLRLTSGVPANIRSGGVYAFTMSAREAI